MPSRSMQTCCEAETYMECCIRLAAAGVQKTMLVEHIRGKCFQSICTFSCQESRASLQNFSFSSAAASLTYCFLGLSSSGTLLRHRDVQFCTLSPLCNLHAAGKHVYHACDTPCMADAVDFKAMTCSMLAATMDSVVQLLPPSRAFGRKLRW